MQAKNNYGETEEVQSTLGFETLDIAAALDLETATPLRIYQTTYTIIGDV